MKNQIKSMKNIIKPIKIGRVVILSALILVAFPLFANAATDLYVSGLNYPTPVDSGTQVYFDIYVKNSGDETAPASGVQLILSGPDNATLTGQISSIGAGSTENIKLSWNATNAGTYNVRACVDTGNIVSETNEYNNCSQTYILTVNSVPVQKTVSLTASPTTVNEGDGSTLSWNTTGVSSCYASGGWSGSKSISGSESTGSLYSTQTFTLTCEGVSDSTTVTVNSQPPLPNPTVNITASPTTITEGNSATLSWSSTNADYCRASGGWSGNKDTSGSQAVYPNYDTTYIIRCYNDDGSSSDSTTIHVNDDPYTPTTPPSVDLYSYRTNIERGESTTLRWNSSNADYCRASGGWSGNRNTSGSISVSPSYNTTYRITCYNNNGSDSDSDSVTIYVDSNEERPTVSIWQYSSYSNYNKATLSWSSNNADYCYASGGWSGSKSTSGSETVYLTESARTYYINCSNSYGSATDSITLNRNLNEPSVSISSARQTINKNESTSLVWSSNDATTCYAYNGWSGRKDLYGSQTVSPDKTTTYTLRCSNSGEAATASHTIYVNQDVVDPTFAVACVAEPYYSRTGQSVVFTSAYSGADEPVSYSWSGVVSGNTRSRTVVFNTAGTKTATIRITDSQGRVRTDTCSTIVRSYTTGGTNYQPSNSEPLTYCDIYSSKSTASKESDSFLAGIFSGFGLVLWYIFLILLNIGLIILLVYYISRAWKEETVKTNGNNNFYREDDYYDNRNNY